MAKGIGKKLTASSWQRLSFRKRVRPPNSPGGGALCQRHTGQGAVIYFATHGLLARETEDVLNMANGRAQLLSVATNGLIESGPNGLKTAPQAEPALVLTPPANGEDNGLLTASEVAALKLDAEPYPLSLRSPVSPKERLFSQGRAARATKSRTGSARCTSSSRKWGPLSTKGAMDSSFGKAS